MCLRAKRYFPRHAAGEPRVGQVARGRPHWEGTSAVRYSGARNADGLKGEPLTPDGTARRHPLHVTTNVLRDDGDWNMTAS